MRFSSTRRSPCREVHSTTTSERTEALLEPGNIAPASEEPDDVALVAGAIKRAGMSTLASLALQIARPLSWTGGQLLWVLQPVLDGLHIGPRRNSLSVSGVARLLESEDGVDDLISKLTTGPEPAKD